MELKHLSSLQILSLGGCVKIKIEGDSFNALTSLIILNLSGCVKVGIIYNGFSNPVSLLEFFLIIVSIWRGIILFFDSMILKEFVV